jgi:hypothetical protein
MMSDEERRAALEKSCVGALSYGNLDQMGCNYGRTEGVRQSDRTLLTPFDLQ